MQLGQIIDETASVASGNLLLSNRAWSELLGHSPEALLKLGKLPQNGLRPIY